jgi:hypothetical protein
MSPAVTPPATSGIPAPPPPPPLPEIIAPPTTSLLDSGSASMPATPTVGSPKLSLKVPEAGMRRQHSFSSLLQKFATDHHFAMEWLEHDDDAASIVSVDSVASVGSSLSGNLSRANSYVDIREPSTAGASAGASASAKPGLTAASVEKLDKKMEGMRIDPNRKKLSQAMIWTWLTSTKQNALPEDAEVMALPKTGDLATGAAGSGEIPKDMKVNTEKLRAKLVKTYPKYYRDLNAMSPNNW